MPSRPTGSVCSTPADRSRPVDEPLQLVWHALAHNREALALTQFTCTTEWPKTAGGRRLPTHPRTWEYDAQRHVRNLRELMKPDHTVLVGSDETTDPPATAAVLHLSFQRRGGGLVAFLHVGAVAMSHRRSGPPYLGDELMTVAEREAVAAQTRDGTSNLVLAGYIHTDNHASMRMAARNGWEPLEAPTEGGYVSWGRRIA